jgi:integrase
VRKVHDVLSSALTAAQADDLIAINPAKQPGAKPPTGKEIKKAKPDMEVWTPAELEAFLAWARNETPDLYVCWLLDMTTGLRRGELLGLRWADVDLRASRLFVRKALVTRKVKGEGVARGEAYEERP